MWSWNSRNLLYTHIDRLGRENYNRLQKNEKRPDNNAAQEFVLKPGRE